MVQFSLLTVTPGPDAAGAGAAEARPDDVPRARRQVRHHEGAQAEAVQTSSSQVTSEGFNFGIIVRLDGFIIMEAVCWVCCCKCFYCHDILLAAGCC